VAWFYSFRASELGTAETKLIAGRDDLTSLTATKKIDTRGLVCPFPAFETGKLAQSAEPNDVLEIISNDEYTAGTSIPAVLKVRKFDYSVTKSDDGNFTIKARKA
jgi:TusA-related sulfurtransferase